MKKNPKHALFMITTYYNLHLNLVPYVNKLVCIGLSIYRGGECKKS